MTWVFSLYLCFLKCLTPNSCLTLPFSPLKKHKTMMPVLQATAMGNTNIEVDGPLNYTVSCDNYCKARVDLADPIDQMGNNVF